jgi:hypothetical protein
MLVNVLPNKAYLQTNPKQDEKFRIFLHRLFSMFQPITTE